MREARLYLEDILKGIGYIETFLNGQSYEQFLQDEKTSSAVIQKFLVIGEASKKIPESLKEQYPDVPWQRMAGMRDRLIHAYFGMDAQLVWQTIHEDLPKLKERLLEILKTL
jgi:uncharacterized protein with HEPN domain